MRPPLHEARLFIVSLSDDGDDGDVGDVGGVSDVGAVGDDGAQNLISLRLPRERR